MKQPKHYWPWWSWVLLAFALWLIMFVAFLRQAYIRITEEEGLTLQTTSMTHHEEPLYRGFELSEMTTKDLQDAMLDVGDLYSAIANEIRERLFQEQLGTALADGL